MTNPDNHLERIAVIKRTTENKHYALRVVKENFFNPDHFSMDEVVNILCKLSILHCKVLFGEAERFEEWLKEKGIKDKDPISTFLDIWVWDNRQNIRLKCTVTQ